MSLEPGGPLDQWIKDRLDLAARDIPEPSEHFKSRILAIIEQESQPDPAPNWMSVLKWGWLPAAVACAAGAAIYSRVITGHWPFIDPSPARNELDKGKSPIDLNKVRSANPVETNDGANPLPSTLPKEGAIRLDGQPEASAQKGGSEISRIGGFKSGTKPKSERDNKALGKGGSSSDSGGISNEKPEDAPNSLPLLVSLRWKILGPKSIEIGMRVAPGSVGAPFILERKRLSTESAFLPVATLESENAVFQDTMLDPQGQSYRACVKAGESVMCSEPMVVSGAPAEAPSKLLALLFGNEIETTLGFSGVRHLIVIWQPAADSIGSISGYNVKVTSAAGKTQVFTVAGATVDRLSVSWPNWLMPAKITLSAITLAGEVPAASDVYYCPGKFTEGNVVTSDDVKAVERAQSSVPQPVHMFPDTYEMLLKAAPSMKYDINGDRIVDAKDVAEATKLLGTKCPF